MSKSEVERFVVDIKTDATLQEAVRAGASDTAALVGVARARGYDVTAEDMRAHIRTHRPELTEEELDSAVGGVYFQLGGGSFNFGIKP